jgi:hypothetical protein
VIKKNNKKVDENMDKINKMKTEIVDLKTTCKSFNQKECSLCDKKLSLPTVHFMCGHTFHDYCVESEGKRRCVKCYNCNYIYNPALNYFRYRVPRDH